MKAIYTHNVATSIVEVFEDLLEENNITIPSEDRVGDEGEAKLFGMEYSNVLDEVEEILIEMLKKAPDAKVVSYVYE